jgi:hypothetical protein
LGFGYANTYTTWQPCYIVIDILSNVVPQKGTSNVASVCVEVSPISDSIAGHEASEALSTALAGHSVRCLEAGPRRRGHRDWLLFDGFHFQSPF